jgi:response regulator RpfG family c-di-GMP phosphodiesterase
MKKIFIIDDDYNYAEATSMLLETKGYETKHFDNSEDGFKNVINEKPDLIILDVMMSNKTDGINLSKKFSETESTKNIPIILVTGIHKEMNLPFKLEPDSEQLPVKVILEKPVKPETLLNNVEKYIN